MESDSPPAPPEVQAQHLIDAVNQALDRPTSYRDPSPVPLVGDAPPVAQPGRAPMSQKATDASALMLSGGLASLPAGAAVTGVLWASGHADPLVIACLCAAPTALLLAVGRLVRRAGQAAPAVHHHTYTGPVTHHQRTVTTHTRGVWANTRQK
ncbi:hypothetical protein ACFYVL_16485 [Streptomyces sp. NPDC004111]|uniref:hypothetical protein n=1 Tax=Streptomyces sp. NPDC004111 TaxID=3364690 RepID=UPI003674EBEC